ncbi:MAG TPA: glycosyltransferase [Microbacterium sp.]|uniref:glycosyltransferase n=1 Tax=Microbacterium sp. TaxID=51671 RepID=UPI002B49CC08|nr:glycosyltransferase [Microbacterium sp.]HKT57169.1 glycosyltransferase [Microbacterium sp.]
MTSFPDADYLVLSSRLIPDLDGGYTLATLARARQMAAAGVHDGKGPLILTVDPGTPADHARHRRIFDERELVVDPARMRNLFDEAADPDGGAASWLRAAARPGAADPALDYRTVLDAHGRPTIGMPVIVGDPDWHISTAPVLVHDRDGRVAGVLDGFGALYRAWLDELVRRLRQDDPQRPVVVLCESRQLGELLAGWDDPGVRLIQATHTIHLEPPYTKDAAVNGLWTRWFGLAERFDAVLWLTDEQRRDVHERFQLDGVHIVVPHGVAAVASVRPPAERTQGRIAMLNRLAPGKRIDHAIRAMAQVVARVPNAVLDVYGDGNQREALQQLIDELGLGAHVILQGPTTNPGAVLDDASVLLFTSAFEGQGLAILEALAHGCPVVSYDVRYGPKDSLQDGGGILVADGDVDGIANALIEVLTDVELRLRLAREAVEASRTVDPDHVMAALASAVTDVLGSPSRRV